MTKRMTKGIATLALMATVLTPIAVAAQENDLQGIRSSRGDSELQRRGYKLEKRSGDSQFWWNSRTDTCIRVNVWRGRYESISSASKSDCGKGGPSAGVVVGAAVAIGLIAALASKKDKGPDYKRGYDDGLNGNPYDRRGNDRYREGYQAGETEAQKRPDPQRDPEFKRGYDDGLYGRAYDRRGNDRYREGYRAGQDEARRPDDRGSLRNVPQAARDACARRADEDLNARRGTSVPVSARELNRSEWEIVVETGRERSRCTVDSRGYVRSLTAY